MFKSIMVADNRFSFSSVSGYSDSLETEVNREEPANVVRLVKTQVDIPPVASQLAKNV